MNSTFNHGVSPGPSTPLLFQRFMHVLSVGTSTHQKKYLHHLGTFQRHEFSPGSSRRTHSFPSYSVFLVTSRSVLTPWSSTTTPGPLSSHKKSDVENLPQIGEWVSDKPKESRSGPQVSPLRLVDWTEKNVVIPSLSFGIEKLTLSIKGSWVF